MLTGDIKADLFFVIVCLVLLTVLNFKKPNNG